MHPGTTMQVSITASCSVVNPWAALIIGCIGAFICYGASRMMLKLRVYREGGVGEPCRHFMCFVGTKVRERERER